MSPFRRSLFTVLVVVAIMLGAAPVPSFSGTGSGLHKAAEEGDLAILREQIEKGADVNATIEKGKFQSCTALIGTILNGYVKAAGILIEKGADVHAKLWGRYSPLVIASAAGQKKIVELLLRKGADRANLERDVARWKKKKLVQEHNLRGEWLNLEAAFTECLYRGPGLSPG